VSFKRNPLAPARRASYTYSSRSKVVGMITLVAAVDADSVICRVASSLLASPCLCTQPCKRI
jgi:hypothetical protein